MSAIDDIPEKLIEAAYERFGRPPEAGGIYIATVTKENDVQVYFRTAVRLAAQPRSMGLWEHYERQVLNDDSEMVMEAGLQRLASLPDLPEEERRKSRRSPRFRIGDRK